MEIFYSIFPLGFILPAIISGIYFGAYLLSMNYMLAWARNKPFFNQMRDDIKHIFCLLLKAMTIAGMLALYFVLAFARQKEKIWPIHISWQYLFNIGYGLLVLLLIYLYCKNKSNNRAMLNGILIFLLASPLVGSVLFAMMFATVGNRRDGIILALVVLVIQLLMFRKLFFYYKENGISHVKFFIIILGSFFSSLVLLPVASFLARSLLNVIY